MQLKIPPPIIACLFLLIFLAIDHLSYPLFDFEFEGQFMAALVLAGFGLLIDLIALLYFFRKKTTIHPLKPKKSKYLVTAGLYRFSRNPMYLGLLFLLLALAIYLGNVLNLFLLPVFIISLNQWQIKPEEEVLKQLFGDEYLLYCSKVRRWL